VRRIGVDERRARLGIRQGLAGAAPDVCGAARRVVALHSTDPASVFLSVHARAPSVSVPDVEHALYEERSLVRMLGMRRTMFVVPADLVPVIQSSTTNAIAQVQRRTYAKLLERAGAGDGAFLADVEEATVRALAARGSATGTQLSTDEPRLRTQVQMAEGKAYGAKVNITTWVLFMLSAEGRIVRGRPLGSWISSQYHWWPASSWLPGGIPDIPVEDARAELVRRWLAAYGPGTVADIKWWTGWTVGHARKAMASVGAVEVDLGGATGYVLPDDDAPVPGAGPWVALLPALDPAPMGWTERSWYLGPHAPTLFDRSGNIGPSVWSDGRIVGGWAQRPDGEIVYRLLEDVGAEATAAVEAAAARLAAWIGPIRVTPRFRTPLERELTA
jgi:hypothetical protein